MELAEILSNLKIEQLNAMQQTMMEAYAEPRDIVLLSPTGSGKTLAYMLPLVQALKPKESGVQAVVLVPSRELALQSENVFRQMGTAFKAMSCYGGRPAMEEHRTMNGLRPSVIIGTPGRMLDHLQKKNFDTQAVQTLVIDEFDKSLEFGFQEEMQAVIQLLPKVKKRILLSATDAEQIPLFTGVGEGKKPIRLDYREDGDSTRLNLQIVKSPEKDKLHTLLRLLCALGSQRTLVFVNYRESVERVTGFLEANKFPCDMFHGGMEQPDRERSIYRLRNGSCPVLISTDLASRGLDIPGIDNVTHYHLPINEEAFTHRNGRTARWDATGSAYMILGPEETIPAYITEDVKEYQLPTEMAKPPKPLWSTIYISKGKKDKLNKVDVVGFLYKVGGLQRDEVGPVDVKDRYCFAAIKQSKVKQLLQLVSGEKIKGMRVLIEEAK